MFSKKIILISAVFFLLTAGFVLSGNLTKSDFVRFVKVAYAGNYNFNQTDWTGGATSTYPNHTSNQSGWTSFSTSTTSTISTGAGVLTATSVSASLSARTDVTQNWVGSAYFSQYMNGRRIAISSSTGVVYIVYYSKEYNASITNIALRSSSDNFASKINISTSTSDSKSDPLIAVGPDGKIHIIYNDNGCSFKYVNSDNWATQTTISYTGGCSARLGMAVDFTGKVYVVGEFGYVTSDNWSSKTAFSDNYNDYPSIAIDSNNKVHMVSYNWGDSIKYIKYRNSDNWNSVTNIGISTSTVHTPSIAIDSTNKIHVAYVSREAGFAYDTIAYRNSDNWGTKVDVSTTTLSDYSSIAIDSTNKVYIVYRRNSTLKYKTSDDWNTENATASSYTFNYSSIAIDSNNKLHIAYPSTEYSGSYFNIAYRNNVSGNFNTRVDVTQNWAKDAYTDYNNGKKIAVAPNGTVYIAYYSYEYNQTYYNIALRSSTDNFASRTDITTSTSFNMKWPSIAVDSSGVVHIAYSDENTNPSTGYAYTNSNNWNQKTRIYSSGGNLYPPSLAVDSTNKVYVAYFGYNDGIRLVNSGDSWGSATTIASLSTSLYPSIAIDSNNKVHIAYYSREYNNSISNIAYRNNVSDSFVTRIDVTATSTSGIHSYNPSIAVDSNNKAHIAYYSYEYSASVYNIAYRNNVSDDFITRTDVTATTTANRHSQYPSIIIDSNNKAHIVYHSKEYNASYWNIAYRNNISDSFVTRTNITTSNGSHSLYSSVIIDSNNQIYITYYSYEYNSNVYNIAYKTYTPASYASDATLTSNWYNTGSDSAIIDQVSWNEDASLPSGASVKVQVQTAPDSSGSPGSATGFVGYDGATSTYFTNSATGCSKVSTTVTCSISSGISIGNGANDQWVQYKIYLVGSAGTPTLSDISTRYVVNAPPEFDQTFGTNGITASQVSDSGSVDWGKVAIQYKVKDTDTDTGTSTPYAVTPTFFYNTGAGWTSITSDYLAAGDTDNKTVATSTYNTYTATWNAKSQVNGTYSTTTQIRITINDNEIANNSTTTTGGAFALDVKNPTSTLFRIDSSGATDSVSYNFSDDSNINYVISNNSDLSADGSNALSNGWNAAGATSTSATTTWTLTGSPSYEKVSYSIRDPYGNYLATTTVAAPSTPTSFDIRDTSNAVSSEWREFIAWAVYSPTSSAPFGSYKLYRATSSDPYVLLTTIGSVGTNYYIDTAVSSSTSYSYKLLNTSSNSDTSNYSSIISDTPDGQGGTDFTAPTITSVSSTVNATWAKISWTTDELSTSEVNYSASSTAYGSTASSTSYLTSHEVTLTGLAPETLYYYRVKSKDVLNNTRTDDNGGVGYSFTTPAGPTISDVTLESATDNSAVITFNTNMVASSSAVYAQTTNSLVTNSSVSEVAGTDIGSGPPYQHRVSLTGLSSRTTYYYYVKAVDTSANTANDTNGNSYYTFKTTYDTKPPSISSVGTPVITRNAAIITWQTDEDSTSQVEWGTTSGSYATSSSVDTTLSIYHSVLISNLSRTTKYYYRVKSKDAQDNEGVSSEANFTTTDYDQLVTQVIAGGGAVAPARDTTPPVINSAEVDGITPFSATVKVKTNEDSTIYIMYGKDTGYGQTAASSDFKTNHEIKLSGLKFGTAYHFKVKAQDKDGNSSLSDDKTFTTKFVAEATEDVRTLENAEQFQDDLEKMIESVLPSLVPPFIGSVKVEDATENSATITWKSNVPTYGSVAYASDKEYDEKKLDPYSTGLKDGDAKLRDHKIELTNLSPSTVYHFRAEGFVIPGVVGKSKDATFITKSSKIRTETAKLGNTNMEVRWITGEETSSFVEYKDLRTGKIGRSGDETKTRTHSVSLENLNPDTSYQVRSFGYDKNNNIVESDPITVKTKKDNTPPVISNIRIDNALIPGRTDRLQSVISWRTDEPSNSTVRFEEGVGISETLAGKSGQEKEYTTDHIIIITGFKPATVYRIQIVSADESDNIAKSSIRSILTPRSAESVLDVITKNLEETFGFLRKLK